MRKFSHFETEDGTKLDHAIINGDEFGDDEFAGVDFDVYINEDGSLTVNGHMNHWNYLSKFSDKYIQSMAPIIAEIAWQMEDINMIFRTDVYSQKQPNPKKCKAVSLSVDDYQI